MGLLVAGARSTGTTGACPAVVLLDILVLMPNSILARHIPQRSPPVARQSRRRDPAAHRSTCDSPAAHLVSVYPRVRLHATHTTSSVPGRNTSKSRRALKLPSTIRQRAPKRACTTPAIRPSYAVDVVGDARQCSAVRVGDRNAHARHAHSRNPPRGGAACRDAAIPPILAFYLRVAAATFIIFTIKLKSNSDIALLPLSLIARCEAAAARAALPGR